MGTDKVQQLPSAGIIETGPVRFGNGIVGVFIDGVDAQRMLTTLKTAPPLNNDGAACLVRTGVLNWIEDLLQVAVTSKHETLDHSNA